ncbi:unnamed protein product [Effrenium voratum]|nr:unnamed protein product [Effrenium voratum]
MPAVLLGSLFALMGLGLFLLGVLPGKPGSLSSVWSLVFGVLSSCGVFALWRHSKLVFLDHICINQADDEMKAGAICSLAGLLNKSDSMLVLWDESYTERLWCVFELAAFLKSTKGLGRPLVICPTLAGPCSVLGFLIVSGVFLPIAISPLRHADLLWRPAVMVAAVSIASSVAAQVFRGLCRSVEVMQKQLLSLKVANTKCTCCIVGHVMDGERLLCDRQAICECMASWFGSVEEFEHCIRSEVVEVVSRELDRAAFGHAFYLGMAAPAFWAILDILPTPVVSGQPLELVFWLTAASIMLGLVFPMYLACARFLAFHFRYKSRNVFGEILKDLMVVLFASPVLAYALGVFLFCSEFCAHLFAPIQAAVFCCMILPMWFSMWLFRRCHGDNCFSRSLSQYRLAVQSC